tara:strand:- start:549783 stop:550859 length:1077 start_codon:yes stop_codon:yes gene_type:complete
MKILFFIESLHSGGKERRLVELIKGLSSDNSIELHLALTKEGIHYNDVLSYNVKIHYLLRRKYKKDPVVFFKFYQLVKRLKPDVIHVWGNMVAIYAIPAKAFTNIPMINNQISDAPTNFSNSILSHKLSFPFSKIIVANSYAGLKAYNAPSKKSKVIYNGFDFKRVSNLKDKDTIKLQFDIKTKYVVGMVASFSDKKDYATYIKAANIVLSKNLDVTFLCIGAGNDNKYKMLVHKGNEKKVLFLGRQINVESIMNVCDIGVLSTYTEGISNSLMEFCALSKPVITNYGGGNIELVDSEEMGYLIRQKSPLELAEKIEILLLDSNKRIRFGKNAKEKIVNTFSIDKMINDFKSTYLESI